jgi:hypothetical protein
VLRSARRHDRGHVVVTTSPWLSDTSTASLDIGPRWPKPLGLLADDETPRRERLGHTKLRQLRDRDRECFL